MKVYQVVFHSGSYSAVDAEVSTREQAEECVWELQAQMYAGGERDFYYEIREVKK